MDRAVPPSDPATPTSRKQIPHDVADSRSASPPSAGLSAIPHLPSSISHQSPRIPDHELLRPIASGAYGEVWLARNAVGTLRAVKIVRRDWHASAESFEREFKGLQKFEPVSRTHEGLVDILTLGLLPDGAGFYYVMELADQAEPGPNEVGRDVPIAPRRAEDSPPYLPRTLRAEVKSRGALPVDEVITLGLKLTAALAHLHAQGLVRHNAA